MKIREFLKVFPERVGLGSFLTRSSLKFTKRGPNTLNRSVFNDFCNVEKDLSKTHYLFHLVSGIHHDKIDKIF